MLGFVASQPTIKVNPNPYNQAINQRPLHLSLPQQPHAVMPVAVAKMSMRTAPTAVSSQGAVQLSCRASINKTMAIAAKPKANQYLGAPSFTKSLCLAPLSTSFFKHSFSDTFLKPRCSVVMSATLRNPFDDEFIYHNSTTRKINKLEGELYNFMIDFLSDEYQHLRLRDHIAKLRKLRDESIFLTQKINAQKDELKQYFEEYDEYEANLEKAYINAIKKVKKPDDPKEGEFLTAIEILRRIESDQFSKNQLFFTQIELQISEQSFFSEELHDLINQNSQKSSISLPKFSDHLHQIAISELFAKEENFDKIYKKLDEKAKWKVEKIEMKPNDKIALRQIYLHQEVMNYMKKGGKINEIKKKSEINGMKEKIDQQVKDLKEEIKDGWSNINKLKQDMSQMKKESESPKKYSSFKDFQKQNPTQLYGEEYDTQKIQMQFKLRGTLNKILAKQNQTQGLKFKGEVIGTVTYQMFECLTKEQIQFFLVHCKYIKELEELDLNVQQKVHIQRQIEKQKGNEQKQSADEEWRANQARVEIKRIFDSYQQQSNNIINNAYFHTITPQLLSQCEISIDKIENLDISPQEFAKLSEKTQSLVYDYFQKKRIVKIYKDMKFSSERCATEAVLRKQSSQINTFDYINQSLEQSKQQYKEYFGSFLTHQENLKDYVHSLGLQQEQRDAIFALHNKAGSDEVYGESLFTYLMQIKELSKVEIEQIYVLSLDWPIDMSINPK